MTTVRYDALCSKGTTLQNKLTQHIGDVRAVAKKMAQDEAAAESPRVQAQLGQAKAQRAATEIELQRHAAHCRDGCKRAPNAPGMSIGLRQSAAALALPPLPKPGALARMIREEGATLEGLAEAYGRSPDTIRQTISNAGFASTTGQPIKAKRVVRTVLSALVGRVPEWMEDGLCAQTDPEAFFPDKGGSTAAAKALCADCPVRLTCLQWAIDNRERFGVWGGLSERERRKLEPSNAA